MTWDMSETSMPRAAISVATSTWYEPSRNPSSAAWRLFCDRFPEAMQPCSLPFQLLTHALGAVLGARKDQDRLCVGMPQQFEEESGLKVLIHRVEGMRDRACRCGVIDLHRDRGLQYLAGQPTDIIGHCCRE